MTRIVFLTYDKEALDYEKNHRKENDIILPIGPSARYYSLSKGWEILTLESLFRKEEYFLEKEDSDQRIKTLVKELNEYSKLLAKHFPLEIGNYFNNHLQHCNTSIQVHILIAYDRCLSPK